jgi:hypothetical protein
VSQAVFDQISREICFTRLPAGLQAQDRIAAGEIKVYQQIFKEFPMATPDNGLASAVVRLGIDNEALLVTIV